jgi:drug/metabolite transporter (DMT)-like permease
MTQDLLGQLYSLLAAVTWAVALVLFKQSVERVPPLALNLFKNVVGIVLFVGTLALQQDVLRTLWEFPATDVAILAASGVIGIALADTVLFHSLDRIGVGILSIVDCLYSPFVILLSAAFLSEKLTVPHYVGAGLILVGVIVSSQHEPPANRTRGQLIAGIFLGVLAIALIAVGIVIAKLVLAGSNYPIMWAASLRMVAGTLALACMTMASPVRKQLWAVFRPARIWKLSMPAAVLGTYLSMVFWIAGFKLTTAAVASILNQTSIVFAIILATVVLHERLTARKCVSLILAVSGTAAVTFADFWLRTGAALVAFMQGTAR